MSSGKIHFHSFDAFRFFAFLKVFIFHAPLIIVGQSGTFMTWYSDHIRHGGGIGVAFFFVLSGFLITYILTHEKIQFGKINLKKFFFRRAFRIWPLFYLIVIIALIIPPDFASRIGFHMFWSGYDPDWRFSLTFLENYKSIIMDNGPRTTPLSVFWSLCIEEHFYILWMIVFFFLKRKYIPYYLIGTVLVAILFRAFEYEIYQTENVSRNDLFTNLDFFSISGLLGYFVAVNYNKVQQVVLKVPFWVRLFYVLMVIVILLNQKAIFNHDSWFLHLFKYTIYAILFTLLLAVFVPQESRLRFSEESIFTKLGKISYGLYVYHLIWIHVVLRLFLDHGIILDNWRTYIIFVACTFSGTVLMSYVSYRYFERPILNLREKIFPPERKK